MGFGTLSAGSMCALGGCCDAGCVMFSSEIFSAGKIGVWGPCRDLCCDDCRDAVPLRLVEALPLSERLGHTPVEAMPFSKRFGHTVLALLEFLATTFCKVSEVVLLGWGGAREHSALDVVRVGFAGLGHAEFAGEGGSSAAHHLPG